MLIEIVKEGSSAVQSAVVALEKLCTHSTGWSPFWIVATTQMVPCRVVHTALHVHVPQFKLAQNTCLPRAD